jgi:hypothetical protein
MASIIIRKGGIKINRSNTAKGILPNGYPPTERIGQLYN